MDTKKMLLICGGVLGGFILLLLVVWLISLAKPKYITYESLENKLVSASKNYVKDNESKFEKDNTRYAIKYQTLVNGGYIKPIEELLKEPDNCAASVTVSKMNGEYSYVPYLNCGDRYTTIELYKQILNDNQVVTSGSGLYRAADGTYYFRGKNVNNFVAFGSYEKRSKTVDNIWQILSIGPDHSIKLRATFTSNDYKTAWDDRYNEGADKYVGYNMFDDSVLQEVLTNLYEKGSILNSEQQSKLIGRHLCVAPRAVEDDTIDGSTECATRSKNVYYYSTITPYEYMRSSIDPNCKSMTSHSCSNFNFIAQNSQNDEWTITSGTTDDFQAAAFDGSIFYLAKSKNRKSLYVVVELNEYSFYKTGDGSSTNPYRIKLSTDSKTEKKETTNK